MLEFQSVVVGYGRNQVLKGVDLDFRPGFHVILGANGAGKTTLFRIGVGLLPVQSGTVRVLGYDPYQAVEIRNLIGYLPHRPTLYANLSVRDNLMFWAEVQGFPAASREERLKSVSDDLELGDLLKKQAQTLSRGQAQRVAIARVLLSNPQVLFLDEPTTGLDPSVARSLRNLLKRLAQAERTIIYSTHNLYEAADLADDVTLLAAGKIIDRGSIDTLKRRYIGRQRVRFAVEGNPEPVFQKQGYASTKQGEHWIVEVPSVAERAKLVEELVAAGVSILDVHDEVNPLETIYSGLEREASHV